MQGRLEAWRDRLEKRHDRERDDDQRADQAKLSSALNLPSHEINFADADKVRDTTGFVIGGVPPVGHKSPMRVLIDETLSRFDVVHAAAGTPHANFPIPFNQLTRITTGSLVDIVEEPSGRK